MTHPVALRIIAAGTLAVALSVCAAAQSRRVDAGSVTHDRFALYWETHLDDPSNALPEGFGMLTELDRRSGVVRRVLLDRSRQMYVGYDVIVRPLAEPYAYSVSFEPLTLTAELTQRLFEGDSNSWIRLPGPARQEPRTVRRGEVLARQFPKIGTWAHALVDYVVVQEPTPVTEGFSLKRPREFAFAAGPARDFTTGDVELRLEEPRVTIDGRFESASLRIAASVAGGVVWVYAPNRGRYLLSLVPHPEMGFTRAGEIRGTALTFSMAGERITLDSAARIAPGQSAFHVYVLHEPAWRPLYANANVDAYAIGAADRAEYLVAR